MMDDMKRMKAMASNPQENEQVRAYAGAFAELERRQRAALREVLAEGFGAEAAATLEALPDHEARVDQMAATLAARVPMSDVSEWDLYAEHMAPDALETAPAEQYAGLGADSDEWADKREGIIQGYRDRGITADEFPDEEVLEHYCRDTFGVDLETFRETVLAFDPATVQRRLVAGPLEDHAAALEHAAEVLRENDDERDPEASPGGSDDELPASSDDDLEEEAES